MSEIDPAAASAREAARKDGGRFGEQSHADPGQLGLDEPATGNDHPAWAQPGCPVAILSWSALQPSVRLVRVDRVTATQVIAGGTRFRTRPGAERYREVGSSRSVELRRADDSEVVHVVAQHRVGQSTYHGLSAASLEQAEELQSMAAQLADAVRPGPQ